MASLTIEEIQAALNGPVQPDPSLFVERMSPRHGVLAKVPHNLPNTAIDNEVSFQSGMPSDYMYGAARFSGDDDFLDGFGFTGGFGTATDFIKGVAKSASELTVGFLGQTLYQLGESMEEGQGIEDRFRDLLEGDIKGLLTVALNPIEGVSTFLEDVGEFTGTKDRMAAKFQSLGRSLMDRNDAWIARNGLALTEDGRPTLLHALGSGTTTVAGALGLAFITKSPTATALLFGQIQNSDTYMEAREQGLDINDAQFYAGISGVVEAALEKIGLDIILRGVGGGFLKNAAKGVITEGTQEAMQTAAEQAIAEMGDFSTLTGDEKLIAIKQAALIGALLGGPGGGVFGGGIKPEDALLKHTMDTVYSELSLDKDVDYGRPTLKLTSQMSEDHKQVLQILEQFLSGMDIEFDTRDNKDKAFASALQSIANGRAKAGQEIIAGKSRLLQEARSNLISRLDALAAQGEDFVQKFMERLPEGQRSQETEDAITELLEMMPHHSSGANVSGVFSGGVSTRELAQKVAHRDLSDSEFLDIKRMSTPLANGDELWYHGYSSLEHMESDILSGSIMGSPDLGVFLTKDYNYALQYANGDPSLVAEVTVPKEYNNTLVIWGDESFTASYTDGDNLQNPIGSLPVTKIDVAKTISEQKDKVAYLELIDELRQDQDFQEQLEGSKGYLSIERRADDLRRQVAEIDREIDRLKNLDPEAQVFEATGKQLEMRDDIFRQLGDIAQSSLVKGFTQGKKLSEMQKSDLQNQFKNIIQKLPLGKGDHVAKVRNRLMRRITRITSNPDTFINELDKLRIDAIVAVDRAMRADAKKKVENLFKKGIAKDKKSGQKYSTVHADIQDSLQRMKQIKKGTLKKTTANLSNDALSDIMENMEVRYARLVGSNDATTLDWQIFGEDLESIIKTGQTTWKAYQNRIKDKRKQEAIDALNKPIKDSRVVSVLNKATGALGLNTMVWTFDTLIDMAGLKNTIFGQVIQKDKVARLNQNIWKDRIKALVAETMPRGYRSDAKNIEITSGDGTVVALNYGQAIQFWMYGQDIELRESMMSEKGVAFTDQNFNDIEAFIGSQGVAFAEGLFSMYRDSGVRMNEEYRKVFGKSLKLRERYSPVVRKNEKDDPVMPVGPDSINMFHEPSSFKRRTNSKNEIIFNDALQNAYTHMMQTEWWLAYHNVWADATVLLRDDDVIEKIESRIGKKNRQALERHVEMMKTYSGEYNIMSGAGIDKFRRNFVKSVLGANPQIGIKQLSSALASLSTVPAADYAKAQAEFWNPVMMPGILKKLSEHESFRGRGKTYDPEIVEMLLENPGKWLGTKGITKFIDFSMMPVRMGDMLGFGSSVYAEYRYLKKIGVPEELALDRAMDNGERSQQSSLPSQMNLMQKDNHPIVRLISMFTTSPIALMNMEMKAVQAYRDGRIDKRDMMRRIAIYHSFIPMLFGFIATAFDTEPEEVVYNGLFGSWGATPIYGSSLVYLGNAITGADMYQKEDWAPDLILDASKANADLLGMAWKDFITNDDSFTMDEYFEAISVAATTDSEILLGLPAQNTIDMLEGAKGLVGEENKWDFTLKTLGWSDYIIEQDNGGGAKVRFTR